ncbi:MAG: hypothetical protein LQ338_004204 [Usnochroma carphineum]|nr:MAG: hypothetical protein LQ338_004204 [Usnochroma carphineum]
MALQESNRKRKAITKDSLEADEVVLSDGGDDFEAEFLDGILSQSEDERSRDSESGLSDEDEEDIDGFEDSGDDLTSEEVPTDDGDHENARKIVNGLSESGPKLVGSSDDEPEPNHILTEDANGNPRYVYEDIDPVYDSDDSDAPETTNTIGNIPLSFYDSYPHIGYDINGKKIARPAKGEALDALLDSIDIPKGWTGLTDPNTGKPLELSEQELDVLKRIQMNEVPEEGYDPYPATVEYFTSRTEIMPLSAAPEPKRRFVPSKHEAKRVMKIVRAIREGRILPYKPPPEEDEEDLDVKRYDIWANEAPRSDHAMNVPAPKLPPPGYDESYHPPPEYLPDQQEKKAWEEADEEDKGKEYLATDHSSLRKVPGYDRFIKEKFERCLDLYLAPRVRRSKLNIDPESLLPKLPSPDELRPFPTTCATIFHGHEGRVRSLAVDPSGVWLASGGDDGTVRIWELLTGRQLWHVKMSSDEAINVVRWRPGTDAVILSAAAGEDLYFLIPDIISPELASHSRSLLDAGFGYAASARSTSSTKTSPQAQWSRPSTRLTDSSVLLKTHLRSTIKVISWHRRGDYLATVSPSGQSSAVAIHTLSKHLTQQPFRRLKGLPQSAQFHPSRPIFFVATQRTIRSYDLSKQELLKIIQPGARWISSFDVHPLGDNLIVGSYDKRLLWHDLDLSTRPYKTLRYHKKAIRQVRFHNGGLPLFADASDDGSLQVFHGKVVGDMMENATIVPVKVLKGHRVVRDLGVLDLDWHPREPWVVSAGSDGTCRLWM